MRKSRLTDAREFIRDTASNGRDKISDQVLLLKSAFLSRTKMTKKKKNSETLGRTNLFAKWQCPECKSE
jgi:hypothetical protein